MTNTIRRRTWALAALLLATFAIQAAIAARRDSVTFDEAVHLPLGLYILGSGDFSLDPINPPLSRMIPALPLLVAKAELRAQPLGRHWTMALWFMMDNAERYQDLFILGRAVVIAASVLLGLLIFRWSWQLHGERAALVTLFLFALSPSLLAHGHLVTVDLLGTLGFVASAYASFQLAARPTIVRAFGVGSGIGIAVLLKLSNLPLLPIMLAAFALSAWREDVTRRRVREWLGFGVIGSLTAALVLNVGYGFRGFLSAFSAIEFPEGGQGSRIAATVPWLRLPLPEGLLLGVDLALWEGRGDELYYLAGELSAEGWWYYHLIAYALKTPLPLLAAGTFAIGRWLLRLGRSRRDDFVFIPLLAIFAINAAMNPLNLGVRHALSADPLMILVAAPIFGRLLSGLAAARRTGLAVVGGLAAIGFLGWYAAATLRIAPRYLEYFNEAAGGPENGHRWLVDSNLDWGQDLIRLSEFMKQRKIETVNLAYFGSVHPVVYGIQFAPLRPGESAGLSVISASLLMGPSYRIWTAPDRFERTSPRAYVGLQEHSPIARVGSFFVYDLPP